MRIRAGGILIQDDKILLMHRIKEKDGIINEYYVIPGGGVESGETLDDTIIREIKEEIGIDVEVIDKDPRYVFQNDESIHYYKMIKLIGGKIGTGTGPEFTDSSYSINGKYIPEMINIRYIIDGRINMVPKEVKEQFIQNFSNKKN